MLRNESPGSSLPSGSTSASIKSEYDSVGYITLLTYTLIFIQEGVLIYATQHFRIW